MFLRSWIIQKGAQKPATITCRKTWSMSITVQCPMQLVLSTVTVQLTLLLCAISDHLFLTITTLHLKNPKKEVVADLEELAAINSDRPYFLLVHVRESSGVARVKSICDKLSGNIEVVPLDIFLRMAGENPTFKEYYYKAK